MNGPMLILIGTVLISLGGIIATYGWNLTARKTERKAKVSKVTRALAAECIFNRDVLDDPIITLKGISDSGVRVKYPRLRTVSIHAAISSGMFLEDRAGDNMYGLLTTTLEHLEEFNRILDRRETQMLTQRMTQNEIQALRSGLASTGALKQIREEVQRFGDHVYDKYALPKHRDWTK